LPGSASSRAIREGGDAEGTTAGVEEDPAGPPPTTGHIGGEAGEETAPADSDKTGPVSIEGLGPGVVGPLGVEGLTPVLEATGVKGFDSFDISFDITIALEGTASVSWTRGGNFGKEAVCPADFGSADFGSLLGRLLRTVAGSTLPWPVPVGVWGCDGELDGSARTPVLPIDRLDRLGRGVGIEPVRLVGRCPESGLVGEGTGNVICGVSVASAAPCAWELRQFCRISIPGGETADVSFPCSWPTALETGEGALPEELPSATTTCSKGS